MNKSFRFAFISVLFLVFIFYSNASFGQKINPTTEEEYNFGMVGYKIQLQNKLPMKQGYRIADFGIFEEPDRTVAFKGLLRQGEDYPCAIIMIYTKDKFPPEYFCIPTEDASFELWERYFKSLKVVSDNQVSQLRFMSYGLSRTLMRLSSGQFSGK
jgi:hypothetical protein